ncbi:20256_t:CDS:1, partial [Dentiscutata erythropus]
MSNNNFILLQDQENSILQEQEKFILYSIIEFSSDEEILSKYNEEYLKSKIRTPNAFILYRSQISQNFKYMRILQIKLS